MITQILIMRIPPVFNASVLIWLPLPEIRDPCFYPELSRNALLRMVGYVVTILNLYSAKSFLISTLKNFGKITSFF